MKMERDILDIIVDKEFVNLTVIEKQELEQFCTTKAEFDELKSAVLGMNAIHFETTQPKAETKQKLDDLFMQTYPEKPVLWYNSVFLVLVPKEKPFYRQPLLQVAALLFVLFLVVPIINTPILDENEQVAKLELVDADKKIDVKNNENNSTVVKEEELNDVLIDDIETEVLSNNIVESNEGSSQEQMPMSFASSEVDVILSESKEGMSRTLVSDASLFEDASISYDSEHPDGIFSGIANNRVNYSTDASDSDDLLGLCTVTF